MPEKQTSKDALFEELSLLGLNAIKQYRLGDSLVALAFPKQKAAIEIDDSFRERPEIKAADEKRDAILESMGWRVLRLRSKDVEADATKAALDVEHFVGDAPEMIDDSEEETIGKEAPNEVKTTPKTQTEAKPMPKAIAKAKIRQPKVSVAKLTVARNRLKNKKSAKRIKPTIKRHLRKKTGRKQKNIRERHHIKIDTYQKAYEVPRQKTIITILLLLIAFYLIYLLIV